MERWTIRRGWCILFVLTVAIQGSATTMGAATASRHGAKGHRKFFSYTNSEVVQVMDKRCRDLPMEELKQLLGSSFNARYMAITEPRLTEENDPTSGKKRGAWEEDLSFVVDEDFAEEISDQPAWEVNFFANDQQQQRRRRKRFAEEEDVAEDDKDAAEVEINREQRWSSTLAGGGKSRDEVLKPLWDCDAKLKWRDLGEDYFPRYLQSVECGRKNCYRNKHVCKPRSFTVRLLKRKSGSCVRVHSSGGGSAWQATGVADLPKELRELWVWEERAVNFCCDCVSAPGADRRYY